MSPWSWDHGLIETMVRPVVRELPETLKFGIRELFLPETIIKWVKMQKFKFPEFSLKTVFRGFPENDKEIPVS